MTRPYGAFTKILIGAGVAVAVLLAFARSTADAGPTARPGIILSPAQKARADILYRTCMTGIITGLRTGPDDKDPFVLPSKDGTALIVTRSDFLKQVDDEAFECLDRQTKTDDLLKDVYRKLHEGEQAKPKVPSTPAPNPNLLPSPYVYPNLPS